MNETNNTEDLLRLLPPVRRARLWRLYAADGRRFLDLWQDGGRALLGARGPGLGRALKAAIDVGWERPFPSFLEPRFRKELLRRWPAFRACRLFHNEDRALAALGRALGERLSPGPADCLAAPFLADPARLAVTRFRATRQPDGDTPPTPGAPPPGAAPWHVAAEKPAPGALLLRPFADALPGVALNARATDSGAPATGTSAAGVLAARYAMPVLPCPRHAAPGLVLALDEETAAGLGPGDLVAPLLLAAALRSLAELDRLDAEAMETVWKRADRRLTGLFERRGPWLLPRWPVERHGEVFRAALAVGILLPPDPGLPALLPGDFDDGEIAPLAGLAGLLA